MALPSSGQLDMYGIRNHSSSGYGWRNIISYGSYDNSGYKAGEYDLGWYRGRAHYKSPGTGLSYFSGGQIHMSEFWGASAFNEWNCACACDCACA